MASAGSSASSRETYAMFNVLRQSSDPNVVDAIELFLREPALEALALDSSRRQAYCDFTRWNESSCWSRRWECNIN